MTVPAQRSRRVPSRAGVALRVLLAAALLVPVGVLFVSTLRVNGERQSFAARERHGIEYLRALGQVTLALSEAQSVAVAGRPVPGEALRRAVEATGSVDSRYGAELRTSERWAGVRAKIEALPDRGPARPDEVFRTYREAGDLLLALYVKVRESSGLIRDPAADSYHLQDAAAEELPESIVAAGRLADLAALATARPAAAQLRTVAELTSARTAVLDPADDLVGDLEAAVDSTESRDLSGNLLSQLDSYQRAVEELGRASALTGTATAINPAEVGAARSTVQTSGAELTSIILTELDVLIRARLDELAGQRRLAIAALALAVLLVLALATVLVLAERRQAVRETSSDSARPADPLSPAAGAPSFAGRPPARSPRSGSSLAGPGPLPERRPAGPVLAGTGLAGAGLAGAGLAGSGPGGSRLLGERQPPGPGGGEPRRTTATEWSDPVPAAQAGPANPQRDNQPAQWGRSDAAR